MIQVNKVPRKCKSALQICTAILKHDFVNFSVKVRWQRRTEGHAFGEEEGEEADLSYATWSTSTWSSSRFSSSWSRKEALKQERGGDD